MAMNVRATEKYSLRIKAKESQKRKEEEEKFQW